jgi:hypothetical protein
MNQPSSPKSLDREAPTAEDDAERHHLRDI